VSYKVILFDLGGVIFTDFFSGGEISPADALQLPPQVVLDAYTKTDLPSYCKNELSDEARWRLFVSELGLPETSIQMCIDEYYQSYQIIPEPVALLEELAKDGTYKLGILSDQPMGVTNYLRKTHPNIFSFFDPALVLISAEVGLSKKETNHAIYKLAMERAGVAAQDILFVDNSLYNIDNAKSLGIGTYLFDIKEVDVAKLVETLRKQL
jgi:HAD superfamily hydrolase (TIGR01509 family)